VGGKEYQHVTAHLWTRGLSQFALLFVVGVFAAACDSGANPAAPTTTTATVSAVVVTGSPTSGMPFQLTATARMTDATTRDVTNTATWSSSDAAIATVSSTGMVTVVLGGELDVRATYQNVVGSAHLLTATLAVATVAVTGPSASSSSFQLTAIARWSDGSAQDVTQSATWRSSDVQVATVTTAGYVSIVSSGEVDLEATYTGVAGSLHVAVSVPHTVVLAGTITDDTPHAQPIAGARVQAFAGVTAHVLSDAQGQFAFALPAGRTIIEVSKDGYETWSAQIDVGGNTDLSIVLSQTPLSATNGVSAARTLRARGSTTVRSR
jgi:trimeric autotransporter adhesin